MLEVKLKFPDRMKMQYTSSIEIPEETTLDQLREAIFKKLWAPLLLWCPGIEPHGMEGLSLADRGIEIQTDEELYERILQGCRLDVILNGPSH